MSETTTMNDAAALLAVARRMVQAHRSEPCRDPEACWAESFAKACEAAEAALLAAGTPQPPAARAELSHCTAAVLRGLRCLLCKGQDRACERCRAKVDDLITAARAVVPPPPDTAAAPTTIPADQREAILSIIAEHGCYCDTYDAENGCTKECWGARIEAVLRAPAPATDDAPTEPKVDEGRVWSLIRDVLTQGMAIQQDDATGSYPSYEALSRRLDAAARERVSDFTGLLRGASPRATAPAPTTEARDA